MARRRKRGEQDRNKRRKRTGKSRLLLWIICGLSAIPVLLLVGYFWLLSWLQGDSFRSTLEKSLSTETQADISIPSPLQLDGNRVSLDRVEWNSTQYLKRATVKGIRAELVRSELFDRCLHATQISLKELDATLDTRKEPAKSYEAAEDSFWSSFTPNRAVADRIECGNTSVSFTLRRSDAKKKPNRYSLKGSSVIATPQTGKENAWLIKLRNGTLSTSHSYLAKSSIRHAIIHFSDYTFNISECQLALTKGNMDVTGSFNTKNRDWSVNFGVGNADMERLLSDSWKEVLTGEFSGSLKMNGRRRAIHSAQGHFTLQKGRFRALSFILRYLGSSDRADFALKIPGQQAAADYLENTFRLVEIASADCDIRFPHSDKTRTISHAWLFDNINIRTKNDELRLAGHVILEQDNKLHGNIRIGINEKNIQEFLELTSEPSRSLLDGCLKRLLNAAGDAGFRWVSINLSGTGDNPQQDFSARLREITSSLGADMLMEKAGSIVKDGLKFIPGTNAPEADEQAPANEPEQTSPQDSGSLINTATDTADSIINTGIKAIPFL